MSFCCGGGMIGTSGTLKQAGTRIHNVPLLFCPVCHCIEVHYKAKSEYEILAEYADADGAAELDFADFVELDAAGELYENCINEEDEEPMVTLQKQIDSSLDMLLIAKDLQDEIWVHEIHQRLRTMNERLGKWRIRRTLRNESLGR